MTPLLLVVLTADSAETAVGMDTVRQGDRGEEADEAKATFHDPSVRGEDAGGNWDHEERALVSDNLHRIMN